MLDRDRLARLPQPEYRTGQASSYDRRSVAPDKPGWFANNDTAQFVRVEKHAGREERVMMDQAGPGTITRFWMGAPHPDRGPDGTIRIYLDGAEQPVVAENADKLLSGPALVGPPLAAVRCIGRNLYLPIPYARHCKVTYEGAGNCWYNIEYRRYPAGTQVRSFCLEDLRAAQGAIERVGWDLLTPSNTLPVAMKMLEARTERLKPGGSMRRALQGPAAVRMLRVRLEADDLAQALRSTVLKVAFDGQPAVWCPVGDFFGSGIGLNPFRDWLREVDRNGLMTCYWVMPFERSCTIELENLGRQPVRATLGLLGTTGWTWDDRSMHFHATWRQQYPIQTKAGDGTMDWNYVEIQGQGVYVGDTLALYNGAGPWWGEGDEKIWVDGGGFPAHFGTGSEDYYGYSFGDRGVFFEAPFHAEPRWEGNNKAGHVTVTRTRSLDAIAFASRLKFDLEIWHWSATTVAYAATTYWYARPGAVSNRVPEPDQARRPIPPGGELVEGEAMEIRAKTGGVTELQTEARWSGGKQLWWRDGKVGDRLELVLPVSRPGRYAIVMNATRAFDYGVFQFHLDGEKLGGPVDLYSAENVVQTFALGTRVLSAGKHRFVAEIVGTNPGAKPRFMLGLDFLRLEPQD
jgi:hypothetical protein